MTALLKLLVLKVRDVGSQVFADQATWMRVRVPMKHQDRDGNRGKRRWIDAGALQDDSGRLQRRYDARPGTAYLLRPDQHVCARWRSLTESAVRAALARAMALP